MTTIVTYALLVLAAAPALVDGADSNGLRRRLRSLRS